MATESLCVSSDIVYDASFLLLSIGVSWNVSVLVLGHLSSSSSKGSKRLGHRAWSLWESVVRGEGVSFYDSSLGSISPLTRWALRFGYLLIINGASLAASRAARWGALAAPYLCSVVARTSDPTVDLLIHVSVATGSPLILTMAWALIAWCGHVLLPGVSHPGGPRRTKIRRSPVWDDRRTNFSDDDGVRWECVVAEDSHRATNERFAVEIQRGDTATVPVSAAGDRGTLETVRPRLTGEPAGRQTWRWTTTTTTTTPKKTNNGNAKRDALIERLASGGRDFDGFNPSVNVNSADRVFRAQRLRAHLDRSGITAADDVSEHFGVETPAVTPRQAARKAARFHAALQTDDGHWAGDYGGPHFLLPGLVVAWYVMGQPNTILDEKQRKAATHYLLAHQQSDGGWGSHIESPSTMFGTVLCYVALRLMGVVEANDKACARGRAFIKEQGGALYASSWAKFFLCLLGCMEWDGHNSVPPEMWLLPNWFPYHPGRMWCHCRMVYLPMGYLYGVRFVYDQAETDDIVQALRQELYVEPYDTIPWGRTRHLVADMDNYSPIGKVMLVLQNLLHVYETFPLFQPLKHFVRQRGITFSARYMAAEDLQTNFVDIGPVNKALNMVSAFHYHGRNADHPALVNHAMRVPDYLWLAEDGLKMQGYNGSQCWDTSFAAQAVAEAGLLEENDSVLDQAALDVWSYLERTQILSTDTSRNSPAHAFEDPANRDRFYRHVSEGGWPFSTSAHGWPISDCTGEGLKAVLVLLERSPRVREAVAAGEAKALSEDRLANAVNVILTLQNEDGGWATYENNRGFGWYEWLNPSEVFGDIMIDYSYAECSMASLTALVAFRKRFPDSNLTGDIDRSVARGRDFFRSIQRPDGSWYGSWACCFTYGCWFGVEGLVTAGERLETSSALRKCCDFLLSHQNVNGGWGEDFTSCYDKDYAAHGMREYGDEQGSGVVNTAWALLALAEAKCDDVRAVRRGVRYLVRRQLPCGDWPQEGISGVFNRACGITYTSYRNVFPMWALGRCANVYGDDMLVEEQEG